MSESRRRSSRKNRNDELRNNEQAIAGLSSARSTPSRKHSNKTAVSSNYDDEAGENDDEELMELDESASEEKSRAEPMPGSSADPKRRTLLTRCSTRY